VVNAFPLFSWNCFAVVQTRRENTSSWPLDSLPLFRLRAAVDEKEVRCPLLFFSPSPPPTDDKKGKKRANVAPPLPIGKGRKWKMGCPPSFSPGPRVTLTISSPSAPRLEWSRKFFAFPFLFFRASTNRSSRGENSAYPPLSCPGLDSVSRMSYKTALDPFHPFPPPFSRVPSDQRGRAGAWFASVREKPPDPFFSFFPCATRTLPSWLLDKRDGVALQTLFPPYGPNLG